MFELAFLPAALEEWNGLDAAIRRQFATKLAKLLAEPRIASMKLSRVPDCYRIRARKAGYRVIYHVSDRRLIVTAVPVARRDKGEAYEKLAERLAAIVPR